MTEKKTDKDHMPYVLREIVKLKRKQLRLVSEALTDPNYREHARVAMRIADRATKLSKKGREYISGELRDRLVELNSDVADEVSDRLKAIDGTGVNVTEDELKEMSGAQPGQS